MTSIHSVLHWNFVELFCWSFNQCALYLQKELLENADQEPERMAAPETEQTEEIDSKLVQKLKDTIMQRDNEISILSRPFLELLALINT